MREHSTSLEEGATNQKAAFTMSECTVHTQAECVKPSIQDVEHTEGYKHSSVTVTAILRSSANACILTSALGSVSQASNRKWLFYQIDTEEPEHLDRRKTLVN